MKWFRFYSEALHDPKVQRLHPALFKHWINLLCLANDSEDRGVLPEVDDIAFALRVKPAKAREILAKLEDEGLLVLLPSGRYEHHGWKRRQRESDDVAARVRRHRDANTTRSEPGVDASETQSEPDQDDIASRNGLEDSQESAQESRNTDRCNVTGPLHETPRKLSRATDTDTDTEISIASPNGLAGQEPPDPDPKPKRLKRARPPDPLFNAIAEAWKGEPYHENLLTPPQASLVGMVTAELRAVGATPEEVPAEWRRIRSVFDNPGPRALSAHWKTDLSGKKSEQSPREQLHAMYPPLT